MSGTIDLGPVRVTNPSDWCDITAEVEAADPPWTLAKPEGVGALQFSIALYRGGVRPEPGGRDLLEMTLAFGRSRGCGVPSDVCQEAGPPVVASASFRTNDDFIRVWHVSDGANFAFVTYLCDPASPSELEIGECEAIVRSVRFDPRDE